MPRPRRSTATALRPAIKALQWDLARFELQCVETRELIARLCAIAGIADEIEPIEQAEAKKRMSGTEKKGGKVSTPSGKTRDKVAKVVGKDKKGKTGSAKSEPPVSDTTPTLAEIGVSKRQSAQADDQASAEELRKVAATIAEANAEVQSAMNAKDASKLSMAVSARAKAERVAGKLLVGLAGRLRLPGISKVESKKYRRDAELTDEEFLGKLRRAQSRAVASLEAPVNKPAKKPAPAKRKSSRSPPKLAMHMTPWTQEPDGSLSRELTAVDGEGAEVAG